MRRKKTPEGYIKFAIMEYLAARKIFFLRVNSGAILGAREGRTWCVRLAPVGTPDILVLLPKLDGRQRVIETIPVWIETKAGKNVQTPSQIEFQRDVESRGHAYIVAHSIDEAKEFIEGL